MLEQPQEPAPMDCASSLLVATGSVTCAIPIEHVSETMRPLPVEPIGAVPSFLLGLAIIRGWSER